MNTTEKAELAASICRIERFSKSGILIYNSEFPDRAAKKMRRRIRRIQTIAKCYAFHAKVTTVAYYKISVVVVS